MVCALNKQSDNQRKYKMTLSLPNFFTSFEIKLVNSSAKDGSYPFMNAHVSSKLQLVKFDNFKKSFATDLHVELAMPGYDIDDISLEAFDGGFTLKVHAGDTDDVSERVSLYSNIKNYSFDRTYQILANSQIQNFYFVHTNIKNADYKNGILEFDVILGLAPVVGGKVKIGNAVSEDDDNTVASFIEHFGTAFSEYKTMIAIPTIPHSTNDIVRVGTSWATSSIVPDMFTAYITKDFSYLIISYNCHSYAFETNECFGSEYNEKCISVFDIIDRVKC